MTCTYYLSNILLGLKGQWSVLFFKSQTSNWYVTLHLRSYVCLGIYWGEQHLTRQSPKADTMWIHFDCQNCHICLLKCLYFLWKEVLPLSVCLFKSVISHNAVQLLHMGGWNLCQPPRLCHREGRRHVKNRRPRWCFWARRTVRVSANAFIIWLPSYV